MLFARFKDNGIPLIGRPLVRDELNGRKFTKVLKGFFDTLWVRKILGDRVRNDGFLPKNGSSHLCAAA